MGSIFFGLSLVLLSFLSPENPSDKTSVPLATDELQVTVKRGNQQKEYDYHKGTREYTVINITVKNISKDTQAYAYWTGDRAYLFTSSSDSVELYYLSVVDHNFPSQTVLAPGQVQEHQVEVIKANSSYSEPKFRIGLVWKKYRNKNLSLGKAQPISDRENFKSLGDRFHEMIEDLQQKPYKIIWSNELRLY